MGPALGRFAVLLAPLALAAAALLAIPACEARADSGHPGGNIPLHQAVWDDDLAAVVHLLGSAHTIDVNEAPSGHPHYGSTPLHGATFSHAAIVATLIAAGADVNVKDDPGATPFHYFVRYREDAAIISLLIAAGADVNAKHDFDGTTPLHDSVFSVDTAIISLLIAAGATVNAKDNDGKTPLHNAIRWGHATIVAFLLSAGAEANAKNNNGETPLLYAARYGHAAIAVALIAAGANVNARTDYGGWTPLHEAVSKGYASIVSVLLSARAEVNVKANYGGETPLHFAAGGGHASIVSVLLSAGAEVNVKANIDYGGRTPLHSAASGGSAAVVSLLLSAGAEVSAKGNNGETPLHLAAFQGGAPVVSLLLSAGAEVNVKTNYGYTPLRETCNAFGCHPTPARFALIAAGGNWGEACPDTLSVNPAGPFPLCVALSAEVCGELNPPHFHDALQGICIAYPGGDYPLHHAAGRGGDLTAVVQLLRLGSERGFDVNAKNNYGRTPLHYAAGWGNATIVATLLAAGADVSAKGNYGDTPLHYAIRWGYTTIAATLLAAGADAYAKNNHGDTPLHTASFWGRAIIAATLLAAGADVNAKRTDGQTPLHLASSGFASSGGQATIVVALLSAGADVNAKTDFGYTPLHGAALRDHATIVATLLAAGADVNAKSFIGITPLHSAAGAPSASVISLLLAAGADVNAKNIDGETPLRETVVSGYSACSPSDAEACAAVRPILIAAGAHWGEACASPLTVNPAGPAVPCICESPNVGAADNCQAPSADACGELNPAKFYSAEKSACVPYAPCVGGTLNPETNTCECPNRLAALNDGVCEYKAATCQMLGGEVEGEDNRVCSGIDWNDTFCLMGSDSAFPCAGLFYHVWLCNDDHNRPALDPWHCAARCPSGLRARGARCASD